MATLREATTDDVDAVLALWRDHAEPSHTDSAAAVAALLAHDPGALLVAEDGGTILGTVIAGWDGWRGSVYRLVVTPAHRRRGLARLLVDAAERRLARHGATRLQAIVVETAPDAVAFWQALGWERQQARLRFVRG